MSAGVGGGWCTQQELRGEGFPGTFLEPHLKQASPQEINFLL